MKTLFVVRGLPGSGKSTLAKKLCTPDHIWEADKYFYDNLGNYNFDVDKLGTAHKWCQLGVEYSMQNEVEYVCVSNTSTTEKELDPYLTLADKYGYRIVSVVVENRHGNTSTHNVPDETLQKMKSRFNIKL